MDKNEEIVQLLKKYNHPKEIQKCKKEDLLKVEGIGEKIAEEILSYKYRMGLKEEIRKMEKEKVELISIYDECYPKNLKELYDRCSKDIGNFGDKKSVAITHCNECDWDNEKLIDLFKDWNIYYSDGETHNDIW